MDIGRIEQADASVRLATVVRDSNDAGTLQDLDGNITAWNRGATRLYGWTEAEALGMNVRQIVPDSHLAERRPVR